jgi:hypothetical protein
MLSHSQQKKFLKNHRLVGNDVDGGHLGVCLINGDTLEGIGAASKVVAENLGVPHLNHWDDQSFGYLRQSIATHLLVPPSSSPFTSP